MSSWGNYDNAANTPYWSAGAVNLRQNLTNSTSLYLNTTQDAFRVDLPNGGSRLADETLGLFMVDANEEAVQLTYGNPPAHTGWNLKKTGSGGRAGRVQWETLVALANVQSDNNSDDAVLPDSIITITSQPAAVVGPVSAASSDTVSLSVVAAITSGAVVPLSYQWQVNNNSGGTWVNMNAGNGITTGQPGNMTKTGANTATLILDPTGTTANNYVFRCIVTATGTGATATSANARILITA